MLGATGVADSGPKLLVLWLRRMGPMLLALMEMARGEAGWLW